MLNDEVICFTGKSPKPRKEMMKIANRAGATVSNSITKKVTILVMADINSSSNKAVKARSMGIQLITPETFFQLANEKNTSTIINGHIQHPKKNQPRRRIVLDQ